MSIHHSESFSECPLSAHSVPILSPGPLGTWLCSGRGGTCGGLAGNLAGLIAAGGVVSFGPGLESSVTFVATPVDELHFLRLKKRLEQRSPQTLEYFNWESPGDVQWGN